MEEQVRTWLTRALALLWIAQAVPWGVLLLWSGSESSLAPMPVVVSYLMYLVWAAGLLRWVMRRPEVGWVPIAAAIAVMTAAEAFVGFVLPAEAVATWQNWTPAPATGVAVLAHVYGGYRWGAGAAVALGGMYLATGLRGDGVAQAGTLLGVTGQLVVFTFAGGLVAAKLLGTARQADTEAEGALRAREATARAEERVRQYEVLHDNVLNTLALLASHPALPEAVRAKCAREARFLRVLVDGGPGVEGTTLDSRLTEVTYLQGAHGLEVHYSSDGLPSTMASTVVNAIAAAVTEALNNVAKHAGTTRAWVVATGEPDGEVTVTITDHGSGFDPATVADDTGPRRSMTTRLAEVGAALTIDSGPGRGTVVEILLPANPSA
ncbi:histidine kinase [Actinokineospora globicatena]|nr:histidine kinase [Actinokineospora globicatena]